MAVLAVASHAIEGAFALAATALWVNTVLASRGALSTD